MSESGDDGFQVGTITVGDQTGPNITRLADGRFVVVYQSADNAANGFDIRARVFNPDGTPSGSDFLVNHIVAGDQTTVAVQGTADGKLFFLWQTPDPAVHGNTQLMERTFDESGNALTGEHQLSTSGADGFYNFIQRADGSIFLAYDNNGDILGRTFDSDWNPLSAEVRLNSTTAGTQAQARTVVLANGNILLTYQSSDNGDGGGGDGNDIRDRVFNTLGDIWRPVAINGSTDDFIVNETGTGDQSHARLAKLPDGRVLEVWQSDHGDGSGTSIEGRFISANGNPDAGGSSDEFTIDTTGQGDQEHPAILSFNDGRRLVYWHSFENHTDTVRGMFIHANGQLDSSDFIIGQLPDTVAPSLTLALLADQRVAFVYSGAGSGDGSGAGVQVAVGSLGGLAQDPPFVNTGTSPFDSPLPSFTTDQAAAQISRGNAPWNPELGSAFTMTYAYRDDGSDVTYTNGAIGFDRFSAAQIATTEAAIQLWEDVANIHLVRVQDAGSQYSNNAQILFWNYTDATVNSQAANSAGFGGTTFDPGSGDINGHVFLNEQRDFITAPTFGNNGFADYLHEIGHALGLSHPGNYNTLPNGQTVTYDGNAVYLQDSHQYSVMSYFDETITHANFVDTFAMTPLLDDIAALQRLYGANLTTRTGDTVYGFHSNTGSASFSITDLSQHVVFAVWDAGGNDTLDFSGYTMSQSISLEQEQFSSVGGLEFNVVIAKGTVIENAIGGSGSDIILGNAADNTLTGNGGDDVIAGKAGNDHLLGGDGNDLLDGGPGSDVLDGGAGTDTATYESATGRVAANLASHHGTAGDAAGDTYVSIENVVGSDFADVLRGDAGANMLAGLDGNDRLLGGDGADNLLGGNGNDRLDGGTGADVMTGGAGDDVYFVDNAADQVIETAGGGIDRVYASTSYTLTGGSEIEFLYANAAGKNFALTGNEFVNRIHGGDGNDTLNGGGGADFLYGGAGNDTYVVNNAGVHIVEAAGEGTDTVQASVSFRLGDNLEYLILTGTGAIDGIGNDLANQITGNDAANKLDGGAGKDVLSGGGGDDILIGGAGADVLTGGAGNDIFLYRNITDSVAGARDRIVDFTTGDRIGLSQIDAIAGTSHNDRFTFIGTDAFSGHAGELRYAAAGANTLVSADVTGDGKADFVVLLTGSHTLHSSDFIL